jgi:hypothetical protein
MGDSPAAVVVHRDGTEVAIKDGDAIDATQPALVMAGKDDSGNGQIIRTDGYGSPIVAGPGNNGTFPITGSVVGSITSGSLTGTVQVNQQLPAAQSNRWPVGISDGTQFVGTQSNPIKISNDFSGGEILADQTGADNVLIFSFSGPVQKIVITSVGEDLICKANPFGAVPSATSGIPCFHQIPVEISIITNVVRVYAPSSAIVTVWGLTR